MIAIDSLQRLPQVIRADAIDNRPFDRHPFRKPNDHLGDLSKLLDQLFISAGLVMVKDDAHGEP